jgi:concanavalin A-like lectin/glucanase superfamily protein
MNLHRRHFIRTSLVSASGFACASGLHAAPAVSVYAKRVLEKKPSGYWRLGEKAGPVIADTSGGGHHGTVQGQVAFGQKGMLDREADSALGFDGKTACIEIPSDASFSQPTSGTGLTVEAWMRPDLLEFTGGEGDDGYVHWLGKGEAGKMEWAFRFYPKTSSRPNRISAYIFNTGPGLGSGAYVEDDIKAGKWLHIVAVFDPGNATNPKAGVSLYKDGKLAGSPASSPGALYKAYDIKSVAGDAPLRFGTRDKKSFFSGAVDEVAIYPRVLTAREIADNCRAGRAG